MEPSTNIPKEPNTQDAPQHLEWLQARREDETCRFTRGEADRNRSRNGRRIVWREAHPPPGYEERDYSRRNVPDALMDTKKTEDSFPYLLSCPCSVKNIYVPSSRLAREAKEDEDRHLDQRPQAVIFVRATHCKRTEEVHLNNNKHFLSIYCLLTFRLVTFRLLNQTRG